MNLVKTILIRVLGIMFLLAGLAKLFHLDTMSAALFERAHFPSFLYDAAAAFECTGGMLLLPAKTRRIGALCISPVMLGAIGIHLYVHYHPAHILVPVLMLAVAAYLIFRQR